MKRILIALFAIAALISCSDDSSNTEPTGEIILTPDEAEIRNSQLKFTFDLINAIGNEKRTDNWMVTPFQDFASLSMLANGAADEILP